MADFFMAGRFQSKIPVAILNRLFATRSTEQSISDLQISKPINNLNRLLLSIT